jgi:signal transduction histidine kinase
MKAAVRPPSASRSMPDITERLTRHTQNPVFNYLGIALLIGVVVLLAWLQFKWLTELREQEQARRRVALRVAATNYAAYIGQEMNLLLERIVGSGSVQATSAGEPLFEAVIELGGDGSARISTPAGASWRPATRAQLYQRLGGPLVNALAVGHVKPKAQLWLDPPAVVYCPARCQVGVLDKNRLNAGLLAPAARRMFADFGPVLRSAVTIDDTGTRTVLYPADVRPDYVSVTDLEQALFADVPVLGPAGTRWLLKVNHGGSSLEAAVARSHVRNVLLSGGLLGMLALSIALVVFNARRQVKLAREHLYFAAGVSHELRTPLSVISSAADNLADRTVGEDERVHDYGVLIQREARRLSGMIENVLQFAQSASATHPRMCAKVDMAELIGEVLDGCAALLKDRELHLEVPGALPTVRGDPTALSSALANLVTNAARYATGGNWIRIRAAVVRVRPRGRALRISISNPVVGRPDAHPGRLFEPFCRGQQARAAGIAGTGIGLAVARNVARQHGGGVSIDTAQPRVVKFTLFLPVHESHPAG